MNHDDGDIARAASPKRAEPDIPGVDVDEFGVFRFPNGEFEVYESAQVVYCDRDEDERPEEWLWREWIALGRVTLIEGTGGVGKTLLALGLAARVTRSSPWPGRFLGPAKAGDVSIVHGDDPGAK